MYTNALEYLEDEREGWAPYEALADVPEERFDEPTPSDGPGHGWSARVLMSHMLGWHEICLAIARELALDETSRTFEQTTREWRERRDAMNDDLHAKYAGLPTAELKRRFRDLPGELRGTLTVVPETRWLKHPRHSEVFVDWILEHEAEHRQELDAILGADR